VIVLHRVGMNPPTACRSERLTATTPPDVGHPLAIRGIAAAARLGLSERVVWSLCRCEALPHVRCGRALLFRPDELAAWLDAGAPTEPGAAKRVRAAMRREARHA